MSKSSKGICQNRYSQIIETCGFVSLFVWALRHFSIYRDEVLLWQSPNVGFFTVLPHSTCHIIQKQALPLSVLSINADSPMKQTSDGYQDYR